EAHPGVGGPGTAACSGDLLLGALAACAQVTCQMVASALGIETRKIEGVVEGDLDLRGTLGVSREANVGFDAIRLRYEIDAPDATEEQLAELETKSERYCTVLHTLTSPPPIETHLAVDTTRGRPPPLPRRRGPSPATDLRSRDLVGLACVTQAFGEPVAHGGRRRQH